jgi:hypothetical protein
LEAENVYPTDKARGVPRREVDNFFYETTSRRLTGQFQRCKEVRTIQTGHCKE